MTMVMMLLFALLVLFVGVGEEASVRHSDGLVGGWHHHLWL